MQHCTRHLISKIIRVPVLQGYSYHTNNTKNTATTEEQQGHDLICSKWEEAIIKENRKADIPFDLMQKTTIDYVQNNNHNYKNSNKQQSNLNPMTKSSN